MNRDEIKTILPHREPMLLVDEVELVDGKSQGKYHVRGDEFFLQGHFPGNPVVPGVIQCEMLAQSAFGQGRGHDPSVYGPEQRKIPWPGEAWRCV